jgi:Prophage antirepressor
MQNQIQVFENKQFGEIRMIEKDGQPWFIGKDVADTLGYTETNSMVKRLDEEDFISAKLEGMNMKSILVNESGLYTAIIGSKLPNAREFKRWITSDILPSIRKYGGYITGDTLERLLSDPELAVKYFSMLKTEREKKEALEDRIEVLAPKVRYYDLILQCDTPIPVSVISKDYGMTAIVFNKLLHSFEVQYNIGGTWLLYKNHAGKGYTITKTYHVRGKTSAIHTCWTQKGRQFIYELLKWHGILPQVEREEADKCRT